MHRCFSADTTNVLWVVDATYELKSGEFVYLAVTLDVLNCRIVSRPMSNRLYTELVLRALDMALQRRRHEGVILDSN